MLICRYIYIYYLFTYIYIHIYIYTCDMYLHYFSFNIYLHIFLSALQVIKSQLTPKKLFVSSDCCFLFVCQILMVSKANA